MPVCQSASLRSVYYLAGQSVKSCHFILKGCCRRQRYIASAYSAGKTNVASRCVKAPLYILLHLPGERAKPACAVLALSTGFSAVLELGVARRAGTSGADRAVVGVFIAGTRVVTRTRASGTGA